MAVTPDMIAVALGQAAPQADSITEKQWEMWIEDAYMLVEDRRASFTPVREVDAAKLDYAVRQSVVAHVRKPDDATQVTVSVDDGSTSRTYQSGKGRVTVDDWWVFLGLADEQSGAFSIDTVGVASTHLAWCALAFGAAYCSCGADIAGFPIFEGADW